MHNTEEEQLIEAREQLAEAMDVDVEFLKAVEKLYEVCMKQNPYQN
jgi:hypothetical protein